MHRATDLPDEMETRMETDRRNFLRTAAFAGATLACYCKEVLGLGMKA
jgi:hypothetical protein